jgi:hypothetical protein
MSRGFFRTPRNYDGIQPTGKHIKQLLPEILKQVGEIYQDRPDLILAAWPEVVGERFAPMAQAVSFNSGILMVKVKNSTLHSVLSQEQKPRLLKSLREKFPSVAIRNIMFRIG